MDSTSKVVEVDFHSEELMLASLLKSKSVAEVIADNIQIGQLKQVLLPYEQNEEGYRKEREYFRWWICNPNLGGRFNFKDNISAWETYKLMHETYEIEESDEFTPSWMEEIELTINQAIHAGNYNEFGGQL